MSNVSHPTPEIGASGADRPEPRAEPVAGDVSDRPTGARPETTARPRANQANQGYEPDVPIEISPLLDWPPRPLASLRYLVTRVTLPYGIAFVGLAAVVWNFLTPSMQRMQTLRPRWILEIYLRNALLLVAVAGGLHLVLYMRRRQRQRFKYIPRWPSTSRTFWWNNQVRDNVFWSLGSGVGIWSAYECLTLWFYANGYIGQVQWTSPGWAVYLAAWCVGAFLWSVTHFYLNHRLLHTRWLYDHAHYMHHRNVNTGPWTGIAMHPVEHVIYFSLWALWWVVPVHPMIAILCGLYQGVSPSVSHSGFERVELRRRNNGSQAIGGTAPAGDYFHHLHHRYFECNYGNRPVPLDKLFGTFHDGTPEAHKRMRQRMQQRRGKAAEKAEATATRPHPSN